MQGTGAYDDPFIVTNFYELFEACAQTGKYVNLGADLDGSEYNGGVWDKQIIIDCNYIDGKGHTIKNILDENGVGILKQNNSTYNFKITNINFENIISKYSQNSMLKGFFILSDSNINPCVTFENCYFSLDVCSLCRNTKSLSNLIKFIRCSFNSTYNIEGYKGGSFNMCNIYVKFRKNNFPSYDYAKIGIGIAGNYNRIEMVIPENCHLNNIGFGGGCAVSITSESNDSDVTYASNIGVGNYEPLTIYNISEIKSKIYSYPSNDVIELYDGFCSGNALFLSEEHMKSAEYLNKIGFAAAPE